MRTFVAGAALLGALAFSTALQAQQTTSIGIHVVDASDAPVAGARVELLGTRFAGVSDDAGWVRLQGVPAGPALVRVTRIGYDALQTTVQLAAGAAFEADVELARAPVAVAPVTARSAPQNTGLAPSGFYRRKEMGFGVFRTREDFERSHALRTSDVFRRIPGIRLVPTGGHGYKLVSLRYVMSLSPTREGAFTPPHMDTGRDNGGNPSACEMLTFLDGVMVRFGDIDQVRFDNLGAVEVYRGPSEIPAEFNIPGAACGAVVMWTRTADPATTTLSQPPAPAPNPVP